MPFSPKQQNVRNLLNELTRQDKKIAKLTLQLHYAKKGLADIGENLPIEPASYAVTVLNKIEMCEPTKARKTIEWNSE